jgi:deoxyhypusine synthase
MGPVSAFIEKHFRHFNAATLREAAKAYREHLQRGGKMLVTLAGALSTAEIGLSLAEMIRQGKVHAISCTGANLEEDLFNLVAHDHYRRIPNFRELTAEDDRRLWEEHLNRVTDTCIPEFEAMRRIESAVLLEWTRADEQGERLFPHQFLWRVLGSGKLKESYQIDPRDSWLVAAMEKELFVLVPGWEDSTLGNMYAAHCLAGRIRNPLTVKTGVEYMMEFARFYMEITRHAPLGFLQLGGGIAGDFPICVVPMLRQDLGENIPVWGYFCQVSDSTTSFGSYSGAPPNEKISWGKLGVDTPRFMIESDATIVAPLLFAYILDW